MCSKISLWAHRKFFKSVCQSISWNKFDSNMNRPIVVFQFVTSLIHEGSHMLPTKSLFDVGSRRIFIFIVNTYVSLRCSGNTTRIMRRTLKILLVSTVCETQANNESVLARFMDDLLALDSIVRFDLVTGGWRELPPFQYRLTRSEKDNRNVLNSVTIETRVF